MASITNYSQPSFYHFSRDSIELSNQVAEYINFHELVIDNVADFCCGSGIIALEVLQKLDRQLSESVKSVLFVEKQAEYASNLSRNLEQLESSFGWIDFKINIENLLEFDTDNRFDLIVMNPPYFKAGHGRSSENEKKRICREYKGDELQSFLRIAAKFLTSSGILFFVCREDNHLKETVNLLSKNFFIEKIEEGKGFSIFLLLRSQLH